ncbi:glucose-6-phosphate isomerase [Mycoplasmopsis columbinasalis]|uniref:Glucose-6-phosphate isomerase n=1 Tax=Mycoplasmopsis columbinasalis TaxID=114880 RepID=A0A449B9R8_9BACT|nr:hypothetical protein [Mycoplasmopsis columbinasalis]VEU77916.1 Glucose-6-phosphate isomerase [Mycoplasmopsis columbinasalis]
MKKYLEVQFHHTTPIAKVQRVLQKLELLKTHILTTPTTTKNLFGWIDLASSPLDSLLVEHMQSIYKTWLDDGVEVVVIIGTASAYLTTKAIYDLLPVDKFHRKIQLMFVGHAVTTERLIADLNLLGNRKFAINVISKSGSSVEPFVVFREFRKRLESQVGSNNARKYIVITTDFERGFLLTLAQKQNYQVLRIPNTLTARFSAFTCVTLFPLLLAGYDIFTFFAGAQQATQEFKTTAGFANPILVYLANRTVLADEYKVDLFCAVETQYQKFLEWIVLLFEETETKGNHGLFSANTLLAHNFKYATHTFGTQIRAQSATTSSALDVLTYYQKEYAHKDLYINKEKPFSVDWELLQAKLASQLLPVKSFELITFTLAKLDLETLGYLLQFLYFAATLNGLLNDVDPFNQSAVEVFKNNLLKSFDK